MAASRRGPPSPTSTRALPLAACPGLCSMDAARDRRDRRRLRFGRSGVRCRLGIGDTRPGRRESHLPGRARSARPAVRAARVLGAATDLPTLGPSHGRTTANHRRRALQCPATPGTLRPERPSGGARAAAQVRASQSDRAKEHLHAHHHRLRERHPLTAGLGWQRLDGVAHSFAPCEPYPWSSSAMVSPVHRWSRYRGTRRPSQMRDVTVIASEEASAGGRRPHHRPRLKPRARDTQASHGT
jgi:hypothetical protein